ncbi:TPA: oligosaccharide flippase family protein, partial [Escherichia coli]|nr:oligosaccharide flippase family protein [Escherichia coli]
MNNVSLKEKTITSLIWNAIERFMVQGGQFVIKILIARQISPDDYGLVGIVAVLLVLSDVIINGGFSQALIQKKDRTSLDYSTVFYINIFVAILLYLAFFLLSPLISDFYNDQRLTDIIRLI